MGNTEMTCDTGNMRNKDEMRNRGMTRMKVRKQKKRKTKKSDGKKETHEVK